MIWMVEGQVAAQETGVVVAVVATTVLEVAAVVVEVAAAQVTNLILIMIRYASPSLNLISIYIHITYIFFFSFFLTTYLLS